MAQHKLLTLDGLRGVAALAVIFWHAEALGVGHLGSSYLAVDLFFLMSGFVIALSYERKLLDGMGVLAFMAIRLKRLYPLYILGSLAALIYLIASLRFADDGGLLTPRELSIAAVSAVFYVPMKQAVPDQFLFPLNPPAWSLFLEMAVNLVYAMTARWLSNRALAVVVAISALALVGCAFVYPDMNIGWNWTTLAGGLPRVSFSFFAGVLMYRYRDSLPRLAAPTPVLLAATLAVLALPMDAPFAKLLTLAIILIGFPLIVAAAVQNEPVRLAGAFSLCGAISYPLYALHDPIIWWGNGAAKKLHLPPLDHPVIGWAIMAAAIVGAWLALKLFDEPLRRALRRPSARPVAA